MYQMSEIGRPGSELTSNSFSSTASSSAVKRVFFALWPNQVVRAALAELSRQVHSYCGGRSADAASLHMTLAFLGAVPEKRIDALRAMASEVRFARFTLELDSVGCWRHNHIAWIAPQTASPGLSDLVAKLEAQLAVSGFTFDQRPFAPHVTLVRKADCKSGLPSCAAPGWQIEEFVLVESAIGHPGTAYRIIGCWRCD